MKRSTINAVLNDGKRFLRSMRFHLPPWAFWSAAWWEKAGPECGEIVRNMLGWDITDFGSGDFARCGLVLFTIRNGGAGAATKPYAEKIMIVGENQLTPTHFHWKKTEDIINRGGGNLIIELHASNSDESLSRDNVRISIDGIVRTVNAGEKVRLTPGESICLTPGMYHCFYGEQGKVLVGEVSAVNDDKTDNRFLNPAGRFPVIDEDEPPAHLLVSDYATWVKGVIG